MIVEDLGSIAQRIFTVGDPKTPSGQTHQHEMLNAAEELEKSAMLQALQTSLFRLEVQQRLSGHGETLAGQAELARILDRVQSDYVTSWIQAGAGHRLLTWRLSPLPRLLFILFVAMLDFYVFANAFAFSSGIGIEISDPLYLMGGSIGLLVFFVGMIWARGLKEQQLHRAQGQLASTILAPPRDTLKHGATDRFALILSGTIYLGLLLSGFLVRFTGQEATNLGEWSMILITSLIPLVVVAFEFVVHDPLAVPAATQTRQSPLRRLLARASKKREQALLLKISKVEADVGKRYEFEREALAALHETVSPHTTESKGT